MIHILPVTFEFLKAVHVYLFEPDPVAQIRQQMLSKDVALYLMFARH